MAKPKGIVYLVGAGPGDPGLITIKGKKCVENADVVVWNSNPFSVYAQAEQVFIDGAKVYDRFDEKYQARSDFLLGQEGKTSTNTSANAAQNK